WSTHGLQSGSTQDGTTFLIETGQTHGDGDPFCQVSNNSAVRGISFLWPNQNKDLAPIAFPFAIGPVPGPSAASVSIQDLEFQDAYQGINATHIDRHVIRNVIGQAFFIGILVDGVGDVGRLENVHFIPLWSNFLQNPQTGAVTPPIALWQFQNGTAFL